MKTDPRYKYRYHDIHLEDISDHDFSQIKSQGISLLVNTAHNSQVPVIVEAFMGYLTSKGYRITKQEEKDESK
jgi:predicted metal-dependent TIM-barrel fold hydrolase